MLIAFDFDGTLSDSEMTVLLGDQCGVAAEMEAITERAMNDEIDYATSLRERAALLDGLSEADAAAAWDRVALRDGAAAVINTLREEGHAVAVLTGGFETGVETALDAAGTAVDRVVANRLPTEEGALTGAVEGPLVEGTKDDALETLAAEYGVEPAKTVAVGDGANDLPMLDAAGLAVGFDPKPAVEPACDTVVTSMAELSSVFESRALV